jgi:hypothetical protein
MGWILALKIELLGHLRSIFRVSCSQFRYVPCQFYIQDCGTKEEFELTLVGFFSKTRSWPNATQEAPVSGLFGKTVVAALDVFEDAIVETQDANEAGRAEIVDPLLHVHVLH